MYESFFEFNSRPFAASPVVENYFPADSVEHARQTLIRVVERAEGPGIVVGQTGLGKSLLCRLISEHFRGRFDVAVLSSARIGTRKSLLQSILFELQRPYLELEEGELRLALLDFLQPGNSCENGMLLIIDEADTLPLRLLEEIRMITNLVRDGQPRTRLIMAGGPRLEERFAHPKLDSFNQRLAARCYLESFSHSDTLRYVESQIESVGGRVSDVFSKEALDAVHRASDGIPRLINQVCDHSLVLACAGGKRRLDALAIEEAWADLQQLPGPWREEPRPAASSNIVEFGELDDLSPVELDFVAPAEEATPAGQHGSGFEDLTAAVDEPVGLELSSSYEESGFGDTGTDAHADPAGFDFPQVIVGQQFEDPDEAKATQPEAASEWVPRDTEVRSAGPSKVTRVEKKPASADPFSAPFDEEEIVLDRDEALAIEAFRGRPRVSSDEGNELSRLLEDSALPAEASDANGPLAIARQSESTPFDGGRWDAHEAPQEATLQFEVSSTAQTASPELADSEGARRDETDLRALAFPDSGDDDREMIIIENDLEEMREEQESMESSSPRPVEYQQLFSQLRKA